MRKINSNYEVLWRGEIYQDVDSCTVRQFCSDGKIRDFEYSGYAKSSPYVYSPTWRAKVEGELELAEMLDEHKRNCIHILAKKVMAETDEFKRARSLCTLIAMALSIEEEEQ